MRTIFSLQLWIMLSIQRQYGGAHTLSVQLGPVLGETFESNPLPKEMKELLQCRTGGFVVVHLFLAALARHAVHYPHFPLKTQLWKE